LVAKANAKWLYAKNVLTKANLLHALKYGEKLCMCKILNVTMDNRQPYVQQLGLNQKGMRSVEVRPLYITFADL